MKKNGTAVDVAIAVLVCNGAVHSHSLGLGGGFFMTIYIKAQFNQRGSIKVALLELKLLPTMYFVIHSSVMFSKILKIQG